MTSIGLLAGAAAFEAATSLFEDTAVAKPGWAWLFVVVALAIASYAFANWRRKKSLAALGNPELVRRLTDTVNRGSRVVRAILVCWALAWIVVGLMRVQYGGVAKVVPAAGLDVILAVDYSKSMLAEDVYPSRSERLEAELAHFLDEAGKRGDRVGVVVFAGAARGLPVTSDMRLLRLYLNSADPRFEDPGGTALGKALQQGLTFLVDARRGRNAAEEDELADEHDEGRTAPETSITTSGEADQVIVLLTDGEDTGSRPMEVAEKAAELGVRVYPVGIGSKSGEPIIKVDAKGEPAGYQTDEDGNYITTHLDEELLRRIADTTGGQYIEVSPSAFGLDEVRKRLDELSRAQRQSTIEIDREEGYGFAVFPALVLLSIALALGDRRLHTSVPGGRP